MTRMGPQVLHPLCGVHHVLDVGHTVSADDKGRGKGGVIRCNLVAL